MKTGKSFLYTTCICLAGILFSWFCMTQEVSANLHIDIQRPVTITVDYQIRQEALSDVEFSLYYVADVLDSGEMKLTEQFQNYPIDMDDLKEDNAVEEAEILAAYVKRDKLSAIDFGKTDERGILHFPTEEKTLYAGLYLLIASDHVYDGKLYDTLPLLMYMPAYFGGDDFVYEITLEPKYRMKERTTEISVVKIWDDVTKEYRPSQIEVQLIDGKTDTVKDTVILNRDNNWRHTWTGLSFADWEVIEKEIPPYYELELEREENLVILTNTSTKEPPKDPEEPKEPEKPKEPEEPKQPEIPEEPQKSEDVLPQTGTYWWPVPVLAMSGILCVIAGLIRRRYGE